VCCADLAMAFTMHSHSGQFCPGHAKDQLEDIINHAISLGYKTMGLTEHMPRYDEQDLYPEEVTRTLNPPPSVSLFQANTSQKDEPDPLGALATRHEAYLLEAQRLQAAYADRLHILIGFETDFIRPSFAPRIRELAAPAHVDYYIGSVHPVHGLPIDYNRAMYDDAISKSSLGATEEGLWADYYDEQLGMLQALRPRVVGHFDLIRLLSDEPGRDPRAWTAVWERIVRNLEVVREQGGWLECNSAALRKGLAEPYPGRVIAEVRRPPTFTPFCSRSGDTDGQRRNGSRWAGNSQCRTTATASPTSLRTTRAPSHT
jgi:histidinol-phosphatase (PHP family)